MNLTDEQRRQRRARAELYLEAGGVMDHSASTAVGARGPRYKARHSAPVARAERMVTVLRYSPPGARVQDVRLYGKLVGQVVKETGGRWRPVFGDTRWPVSFRSRGSAGEQLQRAFEQKAAK